MKVPARVYASEAMLEQIMQDRSLEQLVNVATLTGIQKNALVMPDAHEGYGFPIGGVAATAWPDGVISPGGIGYDINCGVRLLLTKFGFSDIKPYLDKLAGQLYRDIPSGVGRGGRLRLGLGELDKVLKQGIGWAVAHKYALREDEQRVESSGCLPNADPAAVSDHAKKRGRDQLGTLGAGNHFVEVGRVKRIWHEDSARQFGLSRDQIVVLIHTGSRGLGHQVATDYVRIMMAAMPKYGIRVPDRELVGVPLSAKEGISYFNAMAAAANFAWTNRQLITREVRRVWQRMFGESSGKLTLLYDVAHNIAKIEEHEIGNKKEKVIMHRKGATRAFGPGSPEIPLEFKEIGQPVIIPGSMGTASYVLAGTKQAMTETFGSTCHGAGRRMSRHAAKRNIDLHKLKRELDEQGVHYRAGSLKGLLEEAPAAYKNIHDVVEIVHRAGIAHKVAELKPLAVIKG